MEVESDIEIQSEFSNGNYSYIVLKDKIQQLRPIVWGKFLVNECDQIEIEFE